MGLMKAIKRGFESLLSGVISKFVVSSGPEAYRFINRRWPILKVRLPQDLTFRSRERLIVLTSSLDEPVWEWTSSGGGSLFFKSQVQDPFYSCMLQNRGNFEQLIVMWVVDGRRFWFCNTFVVFMTSEPRKNLIAQTNRYLEMALEKWDVGEQEVIYSGDLGWFNTIEGKWEGSNRTVSASDMEKAEAALRRFYGAKWNSEITRE